MQNAFLNSCSCEFPTGSIKAIGIGKALACHALIEHNWTPTSCRAVLDTCCSMSKGDPYTATIQEYCLVCSSAATSFMSCKIVTSWALALRLFAQGVQPLDSWTRPRGRMSAEDLVPDEDFVAVNKDAADDDSDDGVDSPGASYNTDDEDLDADVSSSMVLLRIVSANLRSVR